MPRFLHRLQQREFTVTVELDPPKGPDPGEVLRRARQFADRVDAINIADCPMANVRMSPITLAHLVQRDLGAECIFHLTARDRNLIGLQAELLGAAGLGVRNILCLRGDDPGRGDQPDATGVFQVDAVGLAALAASLNAARTVGGSELDAPTAFAIGVAANPTNPDPAAEVARLLAKIEGGAHFAQTQPVFAAEQVFRFQEQLAQRGLADFPVLYGIMPLASADHALRLRQTVPGISIPDEVVRRLTGGDRETGVTLAGELALALHPHVHGIHLFPFNRASRVLGVLGHLEAAGVRRPHPALAGGPVRPRPA